MGKGGLRKVLGAAEGLVDIAAIFVNTLGKKSFNHIIFIAECRANS